MGGLEKLRRFQSENSDEKDLWEKDNRKKFLQTLEEEFLPSYLIRQLEFTEIDEKDQTEYVSYIGT